MHELYIRLEDFSGTVKVARYSAFAIAGEKEDYALNVLGKYSGTAGSAEGRYIETYIILKFLLCLGDSLTYHAGHKFSTYDMDNDVWVEGNCAQAHTGAWWYNSCDMS